MTTGDIASVYVTPDEGSRTMLICWIYSNAYTLPVCEYT
jgi:hypothetical protein